MTAVRTPLCRALAVAALLTLSIDASGAPVDCADRLAELNGYTVADVGMTDPLGFIAPFASPFSSLKQALEIKTGRPFQLDALNRDVVFLRQTLQTRGADSAQIFKLLLVQPRVFACDPDARTLRVSYVMLTNVVSAYVTPSIENANNESERPSTTGATRSLSTPSSFAPLAGTTRREASSAG